LTIRQLRLTRSFTLSTIHEDNNGFAFLIVVLTSYLRHEIELERHGDDVEANDPSDGEVEVLARCDGVDEESRLRIPRPVRDFTHSSVQRTCIDKMMICSMISL